MGGHGNGGGEGGGGSSAGTSGNGSGVASMDDDLAAVLAMSKASFEAETQRYQMLAMCDGGEYWEEYQEYGAGTGTGTRAGTGAEVVGRGGMGSMGMSMAAGTGGMVQMAHYECERCGESFQTESGRERHRGSTRCNVRQRSNARSPPVATGSAAHGEGYGGAGYGAEYGAGYGEGGLAQDAIGGVGAEAEVSFADAMEYGWEGQDVQDVPEVQEVQEVQEVPGSLPGSLPGSHSVMPSATTSTDVVAAGLPRFDPPPPSYSSLESIGFDEGHLNRGVGDDMSRGAGGGAGGGGSGGVSGDMGGGAGGGAGGNVGGGVHGRTTVAVSRGSSAVEEEKAAVELEEQRAALAALERDYLGEWADDSGGTCGTGGTGGTGGTSEASGTKGGGSVSGGGNAGGAGNFGDGDMRDGGQQPQPQQMPQLPQSQQPKGVPEAEERDAERDRQLEQLAALEAMMLDDDGGGAGGGGAVDYTGYSSPPAQQASFSHASSPHLPPPRVLPVPDGLVATLVSMGFDAEQARRALEQNGNDVDRSVDALLAGI